MLRPSHVESSCDSTWIQPRFHPTLPTRHSLSLYFLESSSDPRQSPPVSLRGPVAGPRPAGVTGHSESLIDVCPQAYPVEDGYQGAFSALVAIFDRVGLLTNVGKKVSMAYHPCWAGAGNRTEAGYSRRLTGVGKTYKERQRERVACGECGTVITAGSMSSHMMTRHGKAATRRHLWAPQTNGGPRLYKMSFPMKDGRRRCLVEGCPGVSATRAAMRVHFVHRHIHDTVVILE